jgi:hypothetical protein
VTRLWIMLMIAAVLAGAVPAAAQQQPAPAPVDQGNGNWDPRRSPSQQPSADGPRLEERFGSRYRSGRSPDWRTFKNPEAPAVRREAATLTVAPKPRSVSGPISFTRRQCATPVIAI